MTLIADTQPADAGDAGDASDAGASETASSAEGAPSDSDAAAGRNAAGSSEEAKGDGAPKREVIAIPSLLEAELRAERRTKDAPEAAGAKPRPMSARLLDYSAHAAMIVGLIGFAWTVSNHVVSHPAPAATVATVAATAAAPQPAVTKATDAELAALKQDNLRLAADLGALRARVGSMEAARQPTPATQAAQAKALQAQIDTLQSSLAAARGDAASQATALGTRLDKLQRELAEATLARPERADLTTGSLPPKEARPALTEAAPLPPARPEVAKADLGKTDVAKPDGAKADKTDAAGKDADKPVIAAYVVRDVSRGVALIEGRRGMLEVVPGVSIPGAGVVKSIERRGKGWAVITTRGQLAYAAPLPTWRRDGGRDYYPSYRYDF